MADLHIEEFFRDAALVLAQLYAAFPRKVSVYVEDIAGADSPDEFGLHSKRHLACFGTMLWLAEEGWIRYVDTIGQLAIDQATLSQSAFVLLSSHQPALLSGEEGTVPPSVQADRTRRIEVIRDALRSGSSTRISAVVQEALFSEGACRR